MITTTPYPIKMNKTTFSFQSFLCVLLISCCSFLSTDSYAQGEIDTLRFRTAFYNVENLFDTVDELGKIDEEFTPEGSKAWTTERYQKKISQISEVITALGFPAVMGFCEVENEGNLKDIATHETLQEKAYIPVHFESPDARGIDVGLLFQSSEFSFKSKEFIRIAFPSWLDPEDYTSRDILHVVLTATDDSEFHFFVNHWPSRRGGTSESEYRRLWVAGYLRRAVDQVLFNNPLAQVIIMGDFNDFPDNRSISNVLGTLEVDKVPQLPGLLYDPFLSLQLKGEGSYNYRGDWNMLDQIIFAGMAAPNPWRMSDYGIFKEDFLLYKGESPNRTYGGDNYYGGYSDHLPVYLDMMRPK
jgi:predicted extracellular nuclease